MGTDFWGVLTVAVSVALVLGRFAVARRLVPLGLREAHNANTAVMFGALYVMYGLIVGFSTYFVAYQYDTAAQKSAQDEAGSVAEIHRLAEASRERSGGRCRTWPSPTPGPCSTRGAPEAGGSDQRAGRGDGR